MSCVHILKCCQFKKRYEKSTGEKNIFYFELSSKPNFDTVGIAVSMWEKHESETIFTYNDVINILYGIGNGFGYRERAYSLGVNDYFGPRQTNIPHKTHNYRPGKSKLEVDYYRQTYSYTEKVSHIKQKLEK